jgi:hypothetical protein
MSALLSTFWSYNTMHKPLNIAERAKLQLAEEVKPMTRREKLMRLAEIARGGRPSAMKKILAKLGWGAGMIDNAWFIFHRIEFMTAADLATAYAPASVFDAAVKDPMLYDAGLRADKGDSVSVARAMQFFELTQKQMHPLSCDCGGMISNAEMASRIEKMAG